MHGKYMIPPKIMSISVYASLNPVSLKFTFYFCLLFCLCLPPPSFGCKLKRRKCKTQIYMTYPSCCEVESTGALKDTYYITKQPSSLKTHKAHIRFM